MVYVKWLITIVALLQFVGVFSSAALIGTPRKPHNIGAVLGTFVCFILFFVAMLILWGWM